MKENKMTTNLNCPVSVNKVDENVLRTASFITVILLITGILLKSYLLLFLLSIDFSLRAFTSGKYSIIKIGAIKIASTINLPKKPVDAAPKKFAAALGTAFSSIIGIFLLGGNLGLAFIFSSLLGICALLEGVFAFCVGCHVYSIITIFFSKAGLLKSRIL